MTPDASTARADDGQLVLYNWATSTCSQKVRMVLWEKNLPFEDRRIDSSKNENLSDWYRALNENAVVPTLTHGANVVIDSSVICEYLDEVFPQIPLRPASAFGRAQMRIWRQFFDEVATPAIRVPSYNRYIRHKWAGMAQAEFDALVERRTIRKHFYRKMGLGGSSPEEEREAIERLRETVLRMNRALAKGPWLVGDQFTLADVAIVPTIVRLSDIGLSSLWDDLPHVASWFERMQSRASFAQTFYPGSRYGAAGSHPALDTTVC